MEIKSNNSTLSEVTFFFSGRVTCDNFFSKITNWVKLKNKQQHSKVLRNGVPMNGHNLLFCPENQKLENFLLPMV